MHAEWADAELSRQLLENTHTATAAAFLGFATLMALLTCIFIAAECASILQRRRTRRQPQLSNPGGIRLVYRSRKSSNLTTISDKITA